MRTEDTETEPVLSSLHAPGTLLSHDTISTTAILLSFAREESDTGRQGHVSGAILTPDLKV